MNQPTSDPLDGAAPDMQSKYNAFTGIGRALRKGDALRQLRILRESASRIEAVSNRLEEIEDRIARNAARNRFELNHLLEFGITPFDRDAFLEVLEDVAQHGGLTLREAAALAHARRMLHAQSVNGPSTEYSESG